MSQRGLVGVYSESDDIHGFPPKKTFSVVVVLFFFNHGANGATTPHGCNRNKAASFKGPA